MTIFDFENHKNKTQSRLLAHNQYHKKKPEKIKPCFYEGTQKGRMGDVKKKSLKIKSA
jgi:hypothetical protein